MGQLCSALARKTKNPIWQQESFITDKTQHHGVLTSHILSAVRQSYNTTQTREATEIDEIENNQLELFSMIETEREK